MWSKLDDGFHSSRKIIEAGDQHLQVAGLYALALSYCGDQGTDGVVPAGWAHRLAGRDLCATLIDLDLWEPIEKGARRHVTRDNGVRVDVVATASGYFIRDFVKLNPTAVEVQCRRSERAVAGRKGAQSRWGKTPDLQAGNGNSHSNSHSTAHPNRIPPDPTLKKNPLSTREGTPRATAPLRCPAGCRSLTFKNERELRSHLDVIHDWNDDQIDAALGATPQPDDWAAIDHEPPSDPQKES
jgi:hypothetical protein